MDKRLLSKLATRAYVTMQIEELLPLEKYEIFIKPDFDSATWRFYNGKHQIVIGTYIFNNLAKAVSPKEEALYMKAYLYHELAHSIWTHKDLKEINIELKKLGFAFSMFNLFEDARIEEKMRRHLKKKFNWLRYETIQISQNPIDIFFYLIQSEHDKKAIESIELNLNHNIEHLFESVKLFYQKAIECESHVEIIELLKKWYDKFPKTPRYIEANILKSYIFSMESKYVDSDEKFNELIEGLENALVVGVSSDKDAIRLRTSKELRLIDKGENIHSLLHSKPQNIAFDINKRNILLNKMKKLFLSPKRATSTTIPSKKLHIKNLVAGNDKIFKRKERSSFVKKRITIVLDMSGSMHAIIKHMRLIVDVLDKMASRNIIDATLILSGVFINKDIYNVLSMPLDKGIIERITPNFHAEGLHNAMSSNIDLLKRSDYVWVLTDGMIGEGPIPREFYLKHKIKLHAFYIGDITYKDILLESFDHVICEDSVLGLGDKIFNLIK